MQYGTYERRDYRPIREGRKNNVRLITENDDKIQIRIVTARRGKEGRLEYKTFETLEVADATPDEVVETIENAFKNGTPSKKEVKK